MSVQFGTQVLVSAECVRIVGKVEDDKPLYRHLAGSGDAGRYVAHDFRGERNWPGDPVPLEWDRSSAPAFEVQPVPEDEVLVRFRRLPYEVPQVGLFIGRVGKTEGAIRRSEGDDEAHLGGPGRKVELCEVALAPTSTAASKGKGRIVLVHPRDMTPVPGRRRR